MEQVKWVHLKIASGKIQVIIMFCDPCQWTWKEKPKLIESLIRYMCLYRKSDKKKTSKTFGQNFMKKKTKIKRKHFNLNSQVV